MAGPRSFSSLRPDLVLYFEPNRMGLPDMSTKTNPLRIIALTAENVKRLTAVHIKPDGNVVQITGRNRQGKTSVLDAIWWALAGKTPIQASPIRNGEERARIRLDLGELIVTRRFAALDDGGYTTGVTVESPDGAVFKRPQDLLDGLVGALSFDPLAFAGMEPKKQFDALKKFVTEADIEHLDALIAGDRERRTEVGKDRDKERGAAAAIVVADEPPAERVDEEALVAKLQEAGDRNALLERRISNRANVAAEIARLRADADVVLANVPAAVRAKEEAHKANIADLDAQIEALRTQIFALQNRIVASAAQLQADVDAIGAEANANVDAARARADELQAKLDHAEALPEPIDSAAIALQLNAARAGNKQLDAWERDRKAKEGHQTKASEHSAEYDRLTASITQRIQEKQAAIAKAHLPVDGLGFGDGFITLNGVPFEQGSDAEQLEASVAIAAALNPRLRVIRIREGSRLDDLAMKRLEEIAERLDFQIWIERVDSSGNVGFVLEDGHLKGLEPEPTLAEVSAAAADATNDVSTSVGGAA